MIYTESAPRDEIDLDRIIVMADVRRSVTGRWPKSVRVTPTIMRRCVQAGVPFKCQTPPENFCGMAWFVDNTITDVEFSDAE